eukprot:1159089-Pelagomonas_calceolata.AAC.18
MVTANKIPVPEPMAPMKSATIVNAPMHMPPKAAAVGMYLQPKEQCTIQCSVPPSSLQAFESGTQHATLMHMERLSFNKPVYEKSL